MFQAAWGSLHEALEVQQDLTLLIRGGTSSIGMAATQLAKQLGVTVIATTRNPAKTEGMVRNGVTHVVIDSGAIADTVRELFPDGVDRVLELVGTRTLLDSLRCAKRKGIVCMTGILGNEWSIEEFEPMTAIPASVKLTTYHGEAEDIDPEALQRFLDGVIAGQVRLNIDRVFQFEEIVVAHRYMEDSRASGMLVVLGPGGHQV